MKKIVVLGGGITGLTVARELSGRYKDRVLLIEKEPYLGGLAATLSENGLLFDLGSHRIHNNYSKKAVSYLKNSLGIEIIKRPRNGLMYFRKTFIRYPPTMTNFINAFSLRKTVSLAMSYFKHLFMRRSKKNISNYKEAIIRAVGDRIYDVFYKDFAIKLWGLPPENIAVDGARRRKTFLNLSSITKSLFGGYKYFFYPKNGIGDIANKLEKDIVCSGANIIKDAMTESVELKGGKVSKLLVKELSGKTMEIDAEVIVSTIPVDSLFALLRFQKNAAYSLKWRGLRLVYLYINHALRHDNDTFYFPNLDIIFGRVSNISKFSPFIKTGSGNTLLTLEIPCSPGDKCWEMPEEELVELCCRDLTRIGLIVKETRIIKHFSKRIEKAYPLYDIGWKNNFQRIYNELKNIGGLFIAGRQGLFLHCNIDHCIIQGLELSDFIISKAKNNASTVWDSRIEKFMSFSARD